MSERPDFHEAAEDLMDAFRTLLHSVLHALAPILVPILKGLSKALDWLDKRLDR